MGNTASLKCTAKGLSPVEVMWHKKNEVLVSGISETIFTLGSITAKDWGEYVCTANNSVGEDTKSVFLKGE